MTPYRITEARLYLLPVQTRVPLKFGNETLESVTCARVALRVEDAQGRHATGWGETPISVQWVWPSDLPYAEREQALLDLCTDLTNRLIETEAWAHPIPFGVHLQDTVLSEALVSANATRSLPIPHLAGLVCLSLFDIAVHDAFARLHERPVYACYASDLMPADLSAYIASADSSVSFASTYPADFLVPRRDTLDAWHLVGGLDPLTQADLSGDEPDDGYPVTLEQWIATDGLKALKIKLRGTDAEWDLDRLQRIGDIAQRHDIAALTADFNCTVKDPEYVNRILDQWKAAQPESYDLLAYVEQPFPYDLEANQIEVHSVSDRQPLYLDESAHDWRIVQLGHRLGWTGVALKTCKTQTGALLSACWALSHNMGLMVQDLTNPMFAQIPHVNLAAHLPTLRGVETNAMQFYPEASTPEAVVHPGLYRRRNGQLDLSTLGPVGFGYCENDIDRALPTPHVSTR